MKLIRPNTITDPVGAFSRASTATYLDTDGLLKTAVVDQMRPLVDPATLEVIGVMCEPAATNLARQSEDFSSGSWSKNDSTVTSNQAAGPAGTMVMDLVTEGTTNGANVSQSIAVNTSSNLSFQVAFRRGNCDWVRAFLSFSGRQVNVWVNLATGQLGQVSVTGAASVVGSPKTTFINGITTVYFTANLGDVTNVVAGILSAAGDGNASRVNNATFYACNADLKIGGVSSYIPTTTSAASRAAETLPTSGLLYSNLPESAPAAYSGATTYSIDQTVSVAGAAGLRSVYRSRASANFNNTPASSPAWWEYQGDTYQDYSSAATYAKGDRVVSGHRVYESAANANTNKPVTDTTWWIDTGATNRWRPFDKAINSQASGVRRVTQTIRFSDRVDTVVLLNCACQRARVTMIDAAGNVVFDQDYGMTSTLGIVDIYSYFFEPITYLSDVQISNLPLYAGAQITVTVYDANVSPLLGALVAGFSKELGWLQMGASIGIQDYSIKEKNVYGDFTVLERSYSRTASFKVYVDNDYVDQIEVILAGYRAQPIVYIGADGFTSTIVYGFYKDFNIEIAYVQHSVCTLELEGLT